MSKKKHAFISAICFALIFILLFFGANRLFSAASDPSPTWEIVQDVNAATPDILFMGNSHAYSSFNTQFLSDLFDKNIYTLAGPAEHISSTVEDLKTLLHYHVPKLIVLEINVSMFELSEYHTVRTRGNILTNIDGIHRYSDKIRSAAKALHIDQIPEIFSIARPNRMWGRWKDLLAGEPVAKAYTYQTMNGFRPLHAMSAAMRDLESQALPPNDIASPNAEFTPMDKKTETALNDFFSITEKNGIEVWLMKSPLLECNWGRLNAVLRVAEAYSHIRHTDILPNHMTSIGLTHGDFYDDAGHLNRRGAAKTTNYVANLISARMGWVTNDVSKIFSYQGEEMVPLENGMYRYYVYNSQEGAQYQFRLVADTEELVRQEFSEQNYFDSYINIFEDEVHSLGIAIFPKDSVPEKDINDGMYLSFMDNNTP